MRHFYRNTLLATSLAAALLALPASAVEAAPGSEPAEAAAGAAPWMDAVTWNLLATGSWAENGNVENRADLHLGIDGRKLLLRAQVLDRRPLDFESDRTWNEFLRRDAGGAAVGLYHAGTGSRLLYGSLVENGLPARVRGPWSRGVPFAETRRPTSADMRTTASRTMSDEIYLYLSSPHLALPGGGFLQDLSLRGFASAQVAADTTDAWRPAFSAGVEAAAGTATVLLEGFATG